MLMVSIKPSGACCGATITGVRLDRPLPEELVAEIRAHWLEYKVVAFPDQKLTPDQLVSFSKQFGDIGEDPFFGHIDEHPQVASIQRNADEKTTIFAEVFHSDWSFMPIPPAGTALYGITIPPVGGNTLFADQVLAYEQLPESLRSRVDGGTRLRA
jgi:taurine dioxygenase